MSQCLDGQNRRRKYKRKMNKHDANELTATNDKRKGKNV